MLLFVCSRNVCRSAAAEAVFKYIVKSSGCDLRVRSAGVHTYRSGEPADPLMQQVAGQRGYNLSMHLSHSVDSFDPADFSHAFWSDMSQSDPLRRWAAGEAVKVSSLMRYSSYYSLDEVLMPVTTSSAYGYAVMLDQIEDACLGLWHHLAKEGII